MIPKLPIKYGMLPEVKDSLHAKQSRVFSEVTLGTAGEADVHAVSESAPRAFPSESRAQTQEGHAGQLTIEVEVDVAAGREQRALDADARKGALAARVAVADCRPAHAHLSTNSTVTCSCIVHLVCI